MRKSVFGRCRGRWLCALAFFAIALVWPAQGHAKSESSPAAALARSHFAQGLKHLDEEQWQEAVTSFESALQLRPSPEVRFNLGTALSELGRVMEALAQIENILADPTARKDVSKAADALKLSLNKRLGRIVVQSSHREDILSVSIDDRFADRDLWGAGIPVDPGPHRVTVSRVDAEGLQKQVEVQPGQTLMIHLVAPTPPNQVSQDARTPQVVAQAKPANRWVWWAAGLAGTALMSVAVVAAQRDGGDVVAGSAGHFQIGAK